MRKILTAAAAVLLMAPAANATHWEATCNDGKNLYYRIESDDHGGVVGYLYMTTPNRAHHLVAIAHGGPYDGHDALCATAIKDPDLPGYLVPVCIHARAHTIFIGGGGDLNYDGTFHPYCTASVSTE